MTEILALKQFKNAMQGFIEQLKALDPESGILMLDGVQKGRINALAKQVGWWEPFKHEGGGRWLTVFGAYGASCAGDIMFIPSAEDKKAWGSDEHGAVFVPKGVVAEWYQQKVRMMLPLLLSWVTRADDALLTHEGESRRISVSDQKSAQVAGDQNVEMAVEELARLAPPDPQGRGADNQVRRGRGSGRKPRFDRSKDEKLHRDYVASGIRKIKEFATEKGLDYWKTDAALKRVRANRSRNK